MLAQGIQLSISVKKKKLLLIISIKLLTEAYFAFQYKIQA